MAANIEGGSVSAKPQRESLETGNVEDVLLKHHWPSGHTGSTSKQLIEG